VTETLSVQSPAFLPYRELLVRILLNQEKFKLVELNLYKSES
jgi:hypothetical protein